MEIVTKVSNALVTYFLFLFVPVDDGSFVLLLTLDDKSLVSLSPFDEEEERDAWVRWCEAREGEGK